MFLLGLPHREAASMEGDGGLWEGKPEMLGHRCAMQGCCVPCPDPQMPWYQGCVAVPLLGPVLRRMGATTRAHHPLGLLLSMDMADDRWEQRKSWPLCFRKAQSVVSRCLDIPSRILVNPKDPLVSHYYSNHCANSPEKII